MRCAHLYEGSCRNGTDIMYFVVYLVASQLPMTLKGGARSTPCLLPDTLKISSSDIA